MTQSSNSAHQSLNWLDLVQFGLWIIAILALFVAIARQPLWVVFLPALVAMGIGFWRSRTEQARVRQLYQTLQQQVDKAIAELEQQNQEQERQFQDFNALFAEIQESQPQYTQEILSTRQSFQTTLARLGSQLESLQTQFKQIPNLGDFQGQLRALQIETQSAIATLQENFNQQNFDELNTVPERLAALSQAIVSLEANFQESRLLANQFSNFNRDIARLQELQTQIQGNSAQQTQAFQDAIARIDERQEDYLKLFQQMAALRATIGHFEHRLQQISQNTPSTAKSSDFRQIRSQLQNLTQGLSTLQSQSERYLQWEDITSLQDEVVFLQHQQPELRNAIAKVSQKNIQLKSQIQQLQEQLESYTLDREPLPHLPNAIANRENSPSLQNLPTIQAEISNLKNQLNQSLETLKQIPALQQRVVILENHSHPQNLQVIRAEIADLQHQLRSETTSPTETQQKWQLRYQIPGYGSDAKALAIAPNQPILAFVKEGYEIQLCHVERNEIIQTLAGHRYYIQALAFSPDSRFLASCSSDKTIKIWDVKTGQLYHSLEGHSQAVYTVMFSLDGTQIISGSKDNTVRLWNISTGELIQTLTGHWGAISGLAVSPDNQSFASGSVLGTTKIWSLVSGELIGDYPLGNRIHDLAYSPNGRILYAACENKTIKRLDTHTGKQLKALTGHQDAVLAIAIAPTQAILASGSRDRQVKFWSLNPDREISALHLEDAAITTVRFGNNELVLGSATTSGLIHVWLQQP
ncbi:MAG: hypothetical protein SAJ12_11250 [Jaaginema sp. PMC 1079.18]|nr:hypothetical protein [Jaaginema sp. PMC 1080.18]MEC4851579.1 hypothetical protein [Jaaginema sp. PMC 1079.18]MEC4866739.1 hypothetical protein [Jaaginema sp. PMC 1078.18]